MGTILINHGVDYKIVNGRIIAIDEFYKDGKRYTAEVDVTDFTIEEIKDFLGY